jgi:deoxycytidine triphosphate deaminase
MAPTTKKLSRETLRRNGIVIETKVSEVGWPGEIAQIRDRILSFDCIIPPEQVELHALYKVIVEKADSISTTSSRGTASNLIF